MDIPRINLDLSTLLNIVISIINVLIAGFLLSETRKLREAETEPEISVYLDKNSLLMAYLDIVVKNIGKGPARRIKFSFNPDSELLKRQTDTKLVNLGYFKGINYLAPNQEYRSMFGGTELYTDPTPPPLVIEVTYTNNKNQEYKNEFIIDMAPYKGMTFLDAKNLNNIHERLKDISTNIRRLSDNVEAITRQIK